MSAHAVCNASGDRASLEEGDRRKQCTYETPTPAFRSGGGRLTRTQKETPRKLPAKRASGQRELSVYEKTVGMLMKAGKRACEMPTDSEGMKVEHERFGTGTVKVLEGPYPNQKATVSFTGHGEKKLLLKFARLKILN